MVFSEYLKSLPARSNPRTDMVRRIADLCCVTESTVYRWMDGQMQPDRLKRRTIAEFLGFPEAELFPLAAS